MAPGTPGRTSTAAWPLPALAMVAVALALLALPQQFEGPELVPISQGHALSLLDTVALIPLLVGTGWLYLGLWTRRRQLERRFVTSPGWSALVVFTAGVGLGLLLASAFSGFWWWWAIGATLFGAVLLAAVAAAARPS